ncbi:aspartate dehydrogenase [Ralstonia insidiosa]|nr:aspartate dehydrogenase [Ralstonia insidiosa]MBA9874005.1 aspartate dehydrogenase [Ralstonia insidiosa]MBA9913395.1 aspartate dehydrogenase [Ralstonia insidiosa]MBA9937147.1 aspartate dehydrogenase [Ralstonia insidiosa]MBA9952476.1 aspartate dehydrogenase [Ralstonia insidiosa]
MVGRGVRPLDRRSRKSVTWRSPGDSARQVINPVKLLVCSGYGIGHLIGAFIHWTLHVDMTSSTAVKHHACSRYPLRIALIGLGAIGAELYRQLQLWRPEIEVCGALVHAGRAAANSASPASGGPTLCTSLDQLLDSVPDIVVECAGHQAVDAYGEKILRTGHDLLLVSVGSLADAERYARLSRAAADSGSQLRLAAGAIGGLDILAAARCAGLRRVQYRARKPLVAWRETAAETVVNLSELTEATVIFNGSAREAALAYPRNANVAATIALATLGFEGTRVELIADPVAHHNVHEIEAEGENGHISIRIDGQPSLTNPKTSMVTAFSLVRQLLNLRAAVAF